MVPAEENEPFLTVGLFFFFQAEDGIRFWSVTGVQPCVLPPRPRPSDPARTTFPFPPGPGDSRKSGCRPDHAGPFEDGCANDSGSSDEATPSIGYGATDKWSACPVEPRRKLLSGKGDDHAAAKPIQTGRLESSASGGGEASSRRPKRIVFLRSALHHLARRVPDGLRPPKGALWSPPAAVPLPS